MALNEYLIEEYSKVPGVSGCEKDVRQVIMKNLPPCCETHTDRIGNLIARRPGSGRKVMVSAHMDEVGFIAKYIKDDGRIKFAPVGKIDGNILISKRVIFPRSSVYGVIGTKPIHLQTREEASSPIASKDLYIDIGASSGIDAGKYVRQGDYAVFDSLYADMGNYIKSRAIEGRAGCAIVTEILNDDTRLDLYGAFTVMEELCQRGAGAAAFAIEPDIAIVIDGTECAYDETSYRMGPVITVMDKSSISNNRIIKRIAEIAKSKNIPFRFKNSASEGSDAGRISRSKAGCPAVTISLPVRYTHSPISMINKKDIEDTLQLVRLVLQDLDKEGHNWNF